MLRFEEENHKYFWNDQEVPSVSQVLKTVGLTRNYDGVDAFYRDRGINVHKALHYYAKGSLDEDSLDPDHIAPYVRAFKKFEAEKKYTVLSTEVPLYSRALGFAGTIDQTAGFIPKEGIGITDLKVTENSDKAADLQLCAYAHLCFENYGWWPSFRLVLELHKDESYRPIYYKTDPKIWSSVMDVYNWKIARRSNAETKEAA